MEGSRLHLARTSLVAHVAQVQVLHLRHAYPRSSALVRIVYRLSTRMLRFETLPNQCISAGDTTVPCGDRASPYVCRVGIHMQSSIALAMLPAVQLGTKPHPRTMFAPLHRR